VVRSAVLPVCWSVVVRSAVLPRDRTACILKKGVVQLVHVLVVFGTISACVGCFWYN
jgi:hypothetical protein